MHLLICEIQTFVRSLQVLHCSSKAGNRDKENGNEIMSRHKLTEAVAKVRPPSSLSHVLSKNRISRAVFKLTVHFCFHYVASASPLYHVHCLFLPCAASLPHFCPPLLPPSLHPRGEWPGLIAVSIAHGFPLLPRPDFCSKCACSWVWNILFFP